MYSTIFLNGHHVVLTPSKSRSGYYQEANFKGTGKALCGVLKKGETLPEWLKRTKKITK